MRWPGNVPAGGVSNEIVHQMSLKTVHEGLQSLGIEDNGGVPAPWRPASRHRRATQQPS
jgi:hypothetical protein